MKQLFFALFILTTCTINVSCKKEAPNNTTVNPPPPPPPPTGSVSFWREDLLWVYYGSVFVSINNELKILNSWYEGSGPTVCTDQATLLFNMPYGNYTWKAWKSYSTDTARGTISISQNCMLQQIIF